VGESDRPSELRSADEPAQFPPPEWGKERSPVVGRLITVAVAVVCVAAVAGLAVWGVNQLRAEDDPSGAARPPNTVRESAPPTTATSRGANEANVGDCVKVVKGGLDAELEVLECGTPAAIYRVALELEMGERCPTGPYTEYSITGLGGWSLCLALDARPVQCFATNVPEAGFAATDCATADVKVEAVLTGTADGEACPPPPPDVAFYPRPLVYPTPPLTICLADVPK
jgi:hypothetical protein